MSAPRDDDRGVDRILDRYPMMRTEGEGSTDVNNFTCFPSMRTYCRSGILSEYSPGLAHNVARVGDTTL